MNLVLLLCYSVPLALAAIGDAARHRVRVPRPWGCGSCAGSAGSIVLTNKLNNQAFQTLRGLPKLRVAAAENFAYAAWAGRVRAQP